MSPMPNEITSEAVALAEAKVVQAVIEEYSFGRAMTAPIATNVYTKASVKAAFSELAIKLAADRERK